LLLYQKDGPGPLLRMYIDRIHKIDQIERIQLKERKSDLENLVCTQCDTMVAVPMVYEIEKRLAYRIIKGRIKKVKHKEK